MIPSSKSGLTVSFVAKKSHPHYDSWEFLHVRMLVLIEGINFKAVFYSGLMHASLKNVNPYGNYAATAQKMNEV